MLISKEFKGQERRLAPDPKYFNSTALTTAFRVVKKLKENKF